MTHRTPLKNARLASGRKLADVAASVGTDVGNLSRIERGAQKPGPDLAAKLAAQFARDGITEMHVIYPERFEVSA